MVYAGCVAAVCELVHFFTHCECTDPNDLVDTIHLEVLLPAFAIGCMARSGHTTQMHVEEEGKTEDEKKAARKKLERRGSVIKEHDELEVAEMVGSWVSATFMVLVGLSMPALFS